MPITTRSSLTRAAGATLIAAALVVLAGCSGGAQSVTDACRIMDSKASVLTEQSQDAATSAGAGDFTAAHTTLQELVDNYSEIDGEITNAEVRPLYEESLAQLGAFADVFEGIEDGDTEALTAISAEITEVSTGLQNVGADIVETCGG